MGDYVCDTCGLDCRTPLALGKHRVKCEKEIDSLGFSDRHDKTGDKCPVCKDTWVFFWKKDGDTWVCLACGCHFTPKDRLKVVNDARLKN